MPELTATSWNLFHGRDAPPLHEKAGLADRLEGRSVRGQTHIQVTGDLSPQFHSLIAEADWQICLLQECPPRWRRSLERASGASGSAYGRTSRNWFGPVSGTIASRVPDLVGSWEGGSNLILSRGEAGQVLEHSTVTLTRLPERRKLLLARLDCGLTVGCLHLSTDRRRALSEAAEAIERSLQWAGGQPLLLGGDFNLRPDGVFSELVEAAGLTGWTAGGIDHLLSIGVTGSPPLVWPESERETVVDGLALRLSDHAPVSRKIRIG